MDVKAYRVKPGARVDLQKWDPDDKRFFDGNKEEGRGPAGPQQAAGSAAKELLWAEEKHKVLVVLQGMDTSGKDGTIRHVFEGVNPQGVKGSQLQRYRRPKNWRTITCGASTSRRPAKGEMVIFNRSHYEDVLVVRVHNFSAARGMGPALRADQRLRAATGRRGHHDPQVLPPHQQGRAEAAPARSPGRPQKRWKFSTGDLAERKLWDDYTAAYTAVLEQTSTEHAVVHRARPTASGTATSSSRTPSSVRWKGWTCATRSASPVSTTSSSNERSRLDDPPGARGGCRRGGAAAREPSGRRPIEGCCPTSFSTHSRSSAASACGRARWGRDDPPVLVAEMAGTRCRLHLVRAVT